METIINSVLSQMQNMLDPSQLKHLAEVLRVTLLPTQENISAAESADAIPHGKRGRRLLAENHRLL